MTCVLMDKHPTPWVLHHLDHWILSKWLSLSSSCFHQDKKLLFGLQTTRTTPPGFRLPARISDAEQHPGAPNPSHPSRPSSAPRLHPGARGLCTEQDRSQHQGTRSPVFLLWPKEVKTCTCCHKDQRWTYGGDMGDLGGIPSINQPNRNQQ